MALFIYLISFLEGFTTLSVEIIAIRNFTPIIWTNSISTSIILWIILLALSYWYYIWGKNTKWKTSDELREKIIRNLVISSVYYMFFTFKLDTLLISNLLSLTDNYFISILISSFLLFFIPVFYASQTIPLLSEVLKWDNTGEKIGKLLFFSTIGSFFGSVWTSSILFATIWVEKSATLNSVILSFIAILLVIQLKKWIKLSWVMAIIIFVLWIFLIISPSKNLWFIYEKANSYHNIKIFDSNNNTRIFMQNAWFASGLDLETGESYFEYIKEIKSKIIEWWYESIWIIWAAWFSLPNELSKYNQIKIIDVTDVDSSLKEISEKYFLQEKLDEKIKFYVESARYFINNRIKEWKIYDAIVIDVYVWNSLSPQTLTLEFFEWITKISKDIYINLITETWLESTFSNKLLSTMEEAFWNVYYIDTQKWKSWPKTNFVVTNREFDWYTKYNKKEDLDIYIDDKNTIELDLFEILKW